jgi:sulfur carrier protein
MLTLTVNGKQCRLPAPLSGAALLAELDINASTLVVELNGSIVRREDFLALELQDGDVLELVTIVGGG